MLDKMRVARGLVTTLLALGIHGASASDGRDDPQAPATASPLAPQACRGPVPVTIRTATEAEAQAACDGALRALAFMAKAGLEGPESLTIEIVRQLPGELGGRAVGCYFRGTRRILLLGHDAFQATGTWFRVPTTWELYRAAASHEVAHAIVGCHTEPRIVPVAAHEYVAYVVMFATMDPALRSAILEQFPGPGFGTSFQINDLNHVVDPNRFGTDAWKHYLRTGEHKRSLRQVIAGEVVIEVAPDPGAESR